jgi:L-alanine-DL-glutamate epimerase-like enolase superfamily enzyme
MTQTLVPPAATPTTGDRIRSVTLSHVVLPLPNPVSDAKVLTGRQKPLTETVMLFVELTTEQGLEGMGFSYSKRAGGKGQYAHLKEVMDVAIGQDPNDIAKIYESLMWAGASVGRSGVATQAVAALDVALYDLKARRAGLPLAKLLGAHRDSCRVYNTSGGFLQASVEEIKEKATASLESGIGGIKIKVGQPDWREDLRRVAALREHLGDGPFMVDANQQWDRARARRMCRELEQFDLVWIEEPLDAWDHVGHADLSQTFDTPIATGEMLTSVAEHMGLVDAGYRGIVQPDAPRIGGITPFLRFATLAAHHRLDLAPHYAMEIHLHLAATYPTEPWVEHFEWLNPLFEERIDIRDGQIFVPDRPGLGFTLTERMRELTVETATFSA